MEEEAEAQEEAQVEVQVETQAEAQAETMVEAMAEATAEDHPAEDHQENLLEIPQGDTNWRMTMNPMTRIQTTIWRMTRTEVSLLHQGDPKPPQAITGISSIPWHGEITHPGQKPQVQEILKSATTPSVNAFMKPFRTPLATYSDGHQSLLVT